MVLTTCLLWENWSQTTDHTGLVSKTVIIKYHVYNQFVLKHKYVFMFNNYEIQTCSTPAWIGIYFTWSVNMI